MLVLTPLPSLTIFTEDEAYKQHSQTELILARLTLNSHRLADILAGLSITSGSRENPIDVEEDGQEEDGDGAKAGVLQSRAPEAEERGARDEVLLDGEVEDGEVEDGEVLEVEVTEGGLEEGEVDGGETDDEAPSSSSRKRRRRERSKERTAASREVRHPVCQDRVRKRTTRTLWYAYLTYSDQHFHTTASSTTLSRRVRFPRRAARARPRRLPATPRQGRQ